MSQPNQTKPNPDDLLADFTDRVLETKTSVLASPSENEVRSLEETVLRLNRAFPQEALDQKTVKRLQADFNTRIKKANPSSRSAWQSQQSRQRSFVVFAAIAILAIIFIAVPFMVFGNGLTQATAGLQPESAILLIAASCIIAFLIWLGRHK